MFNLILATVSGSMVGLTMRFAQGRIKARTWMLAFNYMTCMITGALMLGLGNILPKTEGIGLTLTLGCVNGAFYLAGLLLQQISMRKNGVVLPNVFSKIGGLIVPLGLSLVLFGEVPTVLQVVASLLAIGAILYMNLESKGSSAGAMLPLILLFVADGFAGAMSKIYNEVASSALSSQFLLYTFTTALILCSSIAVYRKEVPGIWELFFGMMIGIPNYFSSRFMLHALKTVPSFIAYPVKSIGSIVIISMFGLFFFHEHLRKKQWIGIAVIMAAVVMLYM